MHDARDKFRKLTAVFDPIYQPRGDAGGGGPSDGSPPEAYVPGIHEGYRRQLEAALDLNDSAKLLVAGQPGCGKTTMLLDLAAAMRRDGRVVAFVDLEAHTAVQDLDPVEMYLAALAETVEQAGPELLGTTLEACRRCLAKMLRTEVQAEPGSLVLGLRRLLSLVRNDGQLREEMRLTMKSGGDDDPFDLLSRALSDLAERRPVVILDGLDKLPPVRARQTFLDDKRKPMAEAPAAAILTIPLSVVYEPTFNVLSGRYNNADAAVLPAVRLWHFDPGSRERTRSEDGIAALHRVVSARVDPIDPEIVMPDAIDRAIIGSGGNIRELARLMQAGVIKAHVRKGQFVETQDIEAAIADQRESFRRAYDPSFLPLLVRVRDEYRLDDSSDIAKQLLYGLWVIEYRNGSAWYCLPEPVQQLVMHLERSR
ncbi:MAG: P-loop NTPase fold protein [Nannocystaceae bacterium]